MMKFQHITKIIQLKIKKGIKSSRSIIDNDVDYYYRK